MFQSDVVTLPFARANITRSGTLAMNDGKDGVSLGAAYANTPKTVVGFAGLAGALVGRVHGPEQMKVSGGSYASDPLSRTATMAAVAFRAAYDSALQEMSVAERFSGFVGALLTPAAGVGAGFSIAIIRGLGATLDVKEHRHA